MSKKRRGGRRRKRSLWNQANHVVSQSLRIGASKRGDALGGVDTGLYIYSNASASRMREFSGELTRFIASRHPEVSRLDQIGPGHVQEFIDENAARWSDATRVEYASRLRKLWAMASNVFGVGMRPLDGLDFGGSGEAPPRGGGGMSPEDWERLDAYMRSTSSGARSLPFITRSIGTRVEEACSITHGDVDLSAGTVALRNCKNGRRRTVKIPEGDLPRWRRILEESAGQPTVCMGIRPKSASCALRRALRRLGLSEKYPREGNHAIRKLYARERYLELAGSGMGWREAWGRVQVSLGHGERFRRSLFKAYVGDGLSPGEPGPAEGVG